MSEIKRFLTAFEKTGDALVSRQPVSLPLAVLQKLFGADANDPMFDAFVVTPSQARFLRKHALELDLRRFFYTLDAERVVSASIKKLRPSVSVVAAPKREKAQLA